ncbi:MAG: flavodoxin domain-containing protein [Rubrobacteraceae bacterium]
MKLLVSVASKHGATAEIAEELGRALDAALRERGIGNGDEVVDVRPAEEVDSVDGYDAVVLGSAVYAGHWLKPARELAERHARALSEKPVWLFSSGPVGDPPKPEEDPVDVAEILEATKAREHRVFAGRLDRARLGFAEKAVMLALRAPEGDFRNWQSVGKWAVDVADTVRAEVPA